MIRDSSTIEICMCVCEYFHVVVVQVTAQTAYLMFSKCKKKTTTTQQNTESGRTSCSWPLDN